MCSNDTDFGGEKKKLRNGCHEFFIQRHYPETKNALQFVQKVKPWQQTLQPNSQWKKTIISLLYHPPTNHVHKIMGWSSKDFQSTTNDRIQMGHTIHNMCIKGLWLLFTDYVCTTEKTWNHTWLINLFLGGGGNQMEWTKTITPHCCNFCPRRGAIFGWPTPTDFLLEPFHCHGVTWEWPIKVQNLKSLSLSAFSFALAYEHTFIKTHNIESRFVTGLENMLFHWCVHAHFSPDILQDLAVKGLIKTILQQYWLMCTFYTSCQSWSPAGAQLMVTCRMVKQQ